MIDSHIANCEKCARDDHAVTSLQDLLKSLQSEPVPSQITNSFWNDIHDKIQMNSPHQSIFNGKTDKRKHQWLTWGVPSFAIVCVFVCILLLRPWGSALHQDGHFNSFHVMIESAEIDGHTANISVFETADPEMTFIWLDVQNHE